MILRLPAGLAISALASAATTSTIVLNGMECTSSRFDNLPSLSLLQQLRTCQIRVFRSGSSSGCCVEVRDVVERSGWTATLTPWHSTALWLRNSRVPGFDLASGPLDSALKRLESWKRAKSSTTKSSHVKFRLSDFLAIFTSFHCAMDDWLDSCQSILSTPRTLARRCQHLDDDRDVP